MSRKCPCCGSDNLQLYLETGTSAHFVCLDCRNGYEEPKSPKPPLGVIPELLWKEKRIIELKSAITRYEEAGFVPLKEWAEEAEKLEQNIGRDIERFKSNMREYQQEYTGHIQTKK